MINSRDMLCEVLDSCSINVNTKNCELVVFGAGNTSVLYQNCFVREGITPKYYIDNNPLKQGLFLGGAEIISPKKLCELWHGNIIFEPIVLICSAVISTIMNIKDQLDALNINSYTIDNYLFSRHKNEILSVFDSLADDFSKETYTALICSRIRNSEIPENIVKDNQYFCLKQFRTRSNAEVFVDAGAYVGDTVESFLQVKSGVFKCIYAFEPESRNYQAMQTRFKRLSKEWAFSIERIVSVPAGVGEKGGTWSMFPQESDCASIGANLRSESTPESKHIRIYSLDDYFADKPVSFIKADIEGFEYQMLVGAAQIIQRDKPLLAICIYHSASDMYAIPLLIKSILPDYALSIRHHYSDHLETVLYAY